MVSPGSVPSKCPLCGGSTSLGKTTFTAEVAGGVIVVRHVDATVCGQCGEEWIDDAVAKRLEMLVNDARNKHCEVEVLSL